MTPATRPASLAPRLALAAAAALLGTGIALADEVHRYRVQLDPGLSRLEVEARFAAPMDSITARASDAGEYLVEAWDCGAATPIRMRNRRMLLPVSGLRCMSYTVDLARASDEHRYNRQLEPDNVVVSPSLWLWRPPLAKGEAIEVEFVLPEGVRVSVPWRAVADDRFRIESSPESADAPAVFGNFAWREIEVPGAVLRVSILEGRGPARAALDADAIGEWIRAAATDVTLAYGRFPNPAPQVVVIPVERSRDGSAVPFGQVIRDGGEAVELFIDASRPLDALLRDWTATHEFSHLMLPYLERDHRWVSEGFAQYYQNVLLARSGAYHAARAWRELYAGFERGRLSRPELSPNAAAERGVGSARMKIYWSGAALALMADVELRERSRGKETLDDVLGRFQECCLPSARVWSAPEFFAKLDELASHPVFMPLYRRYADAAGFPDTRPLLARLGVEIDGNEVELRRGAELASVRAAITAPDAAAARWRERLAASHRAPVRRASGSP
jgi:hypothetical protein